MMFNWIWVLIPIAGILAVARRELKPPDSASANQQRAEQLAQRLQG
jgi:hypothetical protein